MATLRSDVQKLFPLKSTKDVLALFRKQMDSDVPDLALISITTGLFLFVTGLLVLECYYYFDIICHPRPGIITRS